MTGEALRWADGEADDQPELEDFVCSPPPPPMHKAKPKHRHLAGAYWEREVQTGIRALRPPVPKDELLLVGHDDAGVVAVSHSFEIGGPGEFKILAAAVALRARGRRPHIGDALFEETLLRLVERADSAGLPSLAVWGLVHPRNGASQALVERHGFDYISDDEDGYQEWWQWFDLTDGRPA